MTVVVLDANVLAPGFVGHASVSVRLIDLWRAGAYELAVSEHLLGELARTFTDPYYRARVSAEQATRILELLRTEARLTPLTVTVSGIATQPKDDLVLATGLSAGASHLATRDKQLLKLGSYAGLRILHPGDLFDLLTATIDDPA
ncbi:MAG: putative toxin-antitoxin system toxin component, PIN family [Thermomicrobiales bacterium]